MINKRMEHAVDYFSKAWTKVVAHKTSHPPAKPPVLLRLSVYVSLPRCCVLYSLLRLAQASVRTSVADLELCIEFDDAITDLEKTPRMSLSFSR